MQSADHGSGVVVPTGPEVVHGTVINGQTKEPIARALVFSSDHNHALITDDEGHFEFKFPPQEKPVPTMPTTGTDTEGMLKLQRWFARNSRPNMYFAKRPGFLEDRNGAQITQTEGGAGRRSSSLCSRKH